MRITKKMKAEYREICGAKYRDRLEGFGKERGEVCFGCRSIYGCGGVIGVNICPTIDSMVEEGSIKVTHNQPKWMDWATRMKN
ncbi:hypothetical protein LCGC14_2954840 [marine sediment metagenome]|uniref:Uncharacterized protein n=1 Tax=marine sediment metagenome TaxID=412755 RepID=A0A0F9A5D6_9ZZZZ